MAPHSSTLAWKIPWVKEPGRLQSMGSLGVGHDWTCLVVQWIRIHLPMEGTWVGSLVREDSTCHGAAKPVGHNY